MKLDERSGKAYILPMAIREILTVPDPRLKTVSKPVEAVTDETRALMDDMLETMYDAPGIGLAAIQIGVPERILVIDLAEEEEPEPLYFVNPEILETSDDMRPYQEGCLSVPDQFEEIDRPDRVRVKFLDYDGNEREEVYEGMMATCLQHEMDHLNGILFIDHLSRLKRQMIIKKIKKARAA